MCIGMCIGMWCAIFSTLWIHMFGLGLGQGRANITFAPCFLHMCKDKCINIRGGRRIDVHMGIDMCIIYAYRHVAPICT